MVQKRYLRLPLRQHQAKSTLGGNLSHLVNIQALQINLQDVVNTP
jgi:hypothetical protein